MLSRGGKIVVNQIELKRCASLRALSALGARVLTQLSRDPRDSCTVRKGAPGVCMYCYLWKDFAWHVITGAALCSGLHEFLKMTVAIPLLNGIPPQHEYLRCSSLHHKALS